jgi:hypothetical protein
MLLHINVPKFDFLASIFTYGLPQKGYKVGDGILQEKLIFSNLDT